ncbi:MULTISPECIES: hypothetical protein [Halorussus]|uniref:hypothetical protein n=1 Tax=Halorussus TaxID=1070314 RepID=UPI0020A16E9C|nr:hypothetical protein [Halorussus vallis]USZ74049.1 hypothetical protein NGM07_11340 [Halorussus vallis]
MSNLDNYAFSRLREDLARQKLPALEEAGLLTPDTIRYLESYRRHYEPGSKPHYETGKPAVSYHNTEHYVNVVRPEVGECLSRAVQSGNLAVVKHAIGLVGGDDSDVPFQDALTLENLIHGDEFRIFVFTGGQGGGKSYLAYTLAKYKSRLCRRDNIPVRAITNSLSAVEMNDELDFVGSPNDLLDYRLENPGHIVLVLDEASSFFSSKAGNAHNLQNFVPFLRRLRKMKIVPIIVSHRAMDIGTDIRKLDSVVFIDKPDQDTAVFYGESSEDDLNDKLLELSNYSTDERYDYDSDDLFISWKWDGLDRVTELMENPQQFRELWETKGVVKDLREVAERMEKIESLEQDRDDLIRACSELDYSQSEIAEFAGVSQSRVNRLLNYSQ